MPLQISTFPLPETRFFKAGSFIFRFKIRGGISCREETVEDGFSEEFEDIVRTVLSNLDNLQPFCTNRFIIFPYKKPLEVCKKLKLKIYPSTIILYVEMNTDHNKETEERKKETEQVCSVSDEPLRKRSRRDSPLEEAILQELIQDMEAECHVTGIVDAGHQHDKVAKMDHKVVDQTQETGQLESTPERPGILKRMVRSSRSFLKALKVQTEGGMEAAKKVLEKNLAFITCTACRNKEGNSESTS